MTYRVTSDRMAWPAGTVISADDLAGSNIGALLAAGHLAEVDEPEPEPDPKPKSRRKAADPEE